MDYSLIVRTDATVIALVLAIGMIVVFFLGRFLRNHWKLGEVEAKGGVGMIQTTLYALFGFILAFAFGMSGQKFDNIRLVFIEESQAFGTAVSRADLYSDSVRKVFRADLREYLEARILTFSDVKDTSQVNAGARQRSAIEEKTWKVAMDESKKPNMLIPSNHMIPALNALFDSSLKRDQLLKNAVPDIIVYMLLILAMVSSFIAGLTTGTMRKRDVLIVICFMLFTSLVIYTTLDLGRPLRGLIRANAGEQTLLDLRKIVE